MKSKLHLPEVVGQDAQERITKTYIRWSFAQGMIYTICGSAVFALIIFKTC